ncbi:MAG: phosphatase PAP2 family protein [Bacteroidaceae bacterium]|nr:phosphatase PAP2 family protein [Bacteroidaceae bacterium]
MRIILYIASFLSSLFRPVYYPTVGTFILLAMSYLSLLPVSIKAMLLGIVYFLTVVVPVVLVYLYRRLNKWHPTMLEHRVNRTIPYCIHLSCYIMCIYVLNILLMPRCIVSIIFVSMLLQCCCVIINFWWKISMHAAGSGAIIGALAAFANIFAFNPVWWMCAAILLTGVVMTSRMILRQHTFSQVIGGCLIGILCAYWGILL